MEDNDFKFLLTMPSELNAQIEKVSSCLYQSKSAFIRTCIRRYLDDVDATGLKDEPETNSDYQSGALVDVSCNAWGFGIARFVVQVAVICFCFYVTGYFIKS